MLMFGLQRFELLSAPRQTLEIHYRMTAEAVNVRSRRRKPTFHVGSLTVRLAEIHGLERRVPESPDNRDSAKLLFELVYFSWRILCGILQRGFPLHEFVPQLNQTPMEDAKIELGATNNFFAHRCRVRQQRLVSYRFTERYQLLPHRNMLPGLVAVEKFVRLCHRETLAAERFG
jgi:hypothetical protein